MHSAFRQELYLPEALTTRHRHCRSYGSLFLYIVVLQVYGFSSHCKTNKHLISYTFKSFGFLKSRFSEENYSFQPTWIQSQDNVHTTYTPLLALPFFAIPTTAHNTLSYFQKAAYI